MSLKAGDRVERTTFPNTPHVQVGSVGTVLESDPSCTMVKWDHTDAGDYNITAYLRKLSPPQFIRQPANDGIGNPESIEDGVFPAGDPISTLLNERGKRYGAFDSHAKVTYNLKRVLMPAYERMEDDQKEALDMICHKLGRIVNGDPHYADSWTDIAGYAQLVADRLIKKQ